MRGKRIKDRLLTFPKAIADALGCNPGDYVEWEMKVVGGKVSIRKV